MEDFKDVFISYKAEEFDDANWVKSVLEKNGVSCWMAPMCIKGGLSYATEIPRAIRNCKVFVLILSEKAQLSKWVPRELDQAINENKIIMPFMLENCSLKDDFNFYLTNVQRYAAFENKSAAIKKMLTEIKSVLDAANINSEEKIQDVAKIQENIDKPANQNNNPDSKLLKKEKKSKQNIKPKVKKNSVKINKKKIAVISVCCLILIIAAFFINQFRYVSIGEERFYLNTYSVSFEEPKSLTEEDLAKLQKLKNLSSLTLDNCSLPKGALKKLLSLNISSLSVKSCNLSDSDFEDVTEISSDIISIYLNDNNLTDLAFLSTVPNSIENLYIDNNKVNNLSFVEGLDIYTLSANNNGITDISPLSHCAKLFDLRLDNNSIASLEPLENCEKLSVLSVNNNKLSNLRGVESSLELSELYAASNNIESLNGLENATLLKNVNLNNNNISNFSVISKSKNSLISFFADNNNISDLSFLSDCISLTTISLNDNDLNSLEAIKNSVDLSMISCRNNHLSDLKGLENLSLLNFADFSHNNLTDVSALSNIGSGDEYDKLYLDLSYNLISNFNIPNANYSVLNIIGNNVNDLSWISNYNISTLLFDYSDQIDYKAANETGVSSYYIYDCPKDKIMEIENILGEYKVEFIYENEVQDTLNKFIPDIFKET